MADNIIYTQYVAQNKHEDFDDTVWLEETNTGPLSSPFVKILSQKDPNGIRDLDRDGYREFRVDFLLKEMPFFFSVRAPFPLASYFADKKPESPSTRFEGLPRALKETAQNNDFDAARKFFTNYAEGADNSLKTVAFLLARHLNTQAMHSGLNLSDAIHLTSRSGFSVFGDGRLRFDCVLFAELARSDLQDIPGLTFQYVSLISRKKALTAAKKESKLDIKAEEEYYNFKSPEGLEDASGRRTNHSILLVSDGKGHHLIVDNDTVDYFKMPNPMVMIKRDYKRHFEKIFLHDSSDAKDEGSGISL